MTDLQTLLKVADGGPVEPFDLAAAARKARARVRRRRAGGVVVVILLVGALIPLVREVAREGGVAGRIQENEGGRQDLDRNAPAQPDDDSEDGRASVRNPRGPGSRLGGAPKSGVVPGRPGGSRTSPTVASLGLSGRLAFTAIELGEPASHRGSNCGGGQCQYYPSDIHTLDLRSGRTAPLASSPLFEQGSRWSPDGSRLAYSVVRGDATAALHTIRADGSDDRQIVSVEGKLAHQPTWSPDGRRIAFVLQNRTTPFGMTCCSEIWMVDADGRNPHRVDEITDSAPGNHPAWSPDGRYLAFSRPGPYGYGGGSTWVLDLETRGVKRFSSGVEPAWSPDGKRMAVASVGTMDYGEGSVVVFEVASGDAIDSISRRDNNLAEPAWSPDGGWIAFTSRVSSESRLSIWVARPNGADMKVVVKGSRDYWAPTWADG